MAVNLPPPSRPLNSSLAASREKTRTMPIPRATSSAIATHAEQSQQSIPTASQAMMEHRWTQPLDPTEDKLGKQSGVSST